MRVLPVYRLRHRLEGRKPLIIHAAIPVGEYSEVYRTLCGAHEGRKAYELQVVVHEPITCRRCLR
jgi:hypothetical protein